MSAPTSPRGSFESEERPGSTPSTPQATASGHQRSISFESTPRARSPYRRSIQFNVDSAEPRLPTRSATTKEKRLSYGEIQTRELELGRERRPTPTGRGLSPPPPKLVKSPIPRIVMCVLTETGVTNGAFPLIHLTIATPRSSPSRSITSIKGTGVDAVAGPTCAGRTRMSTLNSRSSGFWMS